MKTLALKLPQKCSDKIKRVVSKKSRLSCKKIFEKYLFCKYKLREMMKYIKTLAKHKSHKTSILK